MDAYGSSPASSNRPVFEYMMPRDAFPLPIVMGELPEETVSAATQPVAISERLDDLSKHLKFLQQQMHDLYGVEIRAVRVSQEKIEKMFKHRMGFEESSGVNKMQALQRAITQDDTYLSEGGRFSSFYHSQSQPSRNRFSLSSDTSKVQHLDSGERSKVISRISERWRNLHETYRRSIENPSMVQNLQSLLPSASPDMARHEGRQTRLVAMNREMDKVNNRPLRRQFELILKSRYFELLFGLLIILNSIAIGAETEHAATSSASAKFFSTLSLAFAALFVVELAIRLGANHFYIFLTGPDCLWNLFDILMVAISVTEAIEANSGGKRRGGSLLRVVRVVRVMRIVRLMRFAPELRLMSAMILDSMRSFVTAVFVLAAFIYMFALVITMGSVDYLGSLGDVDYRPNKRYRTEVSTYYGRVPRTMYSLLKAITSGQSWGELMDPLSDVGEFYVVVFTFYVCFTTFAFLNVITGIFVDGALEKARHDRDFVARKEVEFKRACVHNLKQLFKEIDTDSSGTISLEELEEKLQDPKFEAYLMTLDIDTSNTEELFDFLDTDHNGLLEMNEFVEKLMHLTRAQTSEQSVQRLAHDVRMMHRDFTAFVGFFDNAVTQITALRNAVENTWWRQVGTTV